MKSVLISIQPYWVFLIIAKTMGWNIPQEKEIEVRKSYPKAENWNKVAKIYCSKDKRSFSKIPEEYQPLMEQLLGKVIGEFVCDCYDAYWFTEADTDIEQYEDVQLSCVPVKELLDYANSQELYFWNISDLKIYDVPKALSDFRKPCINDLYCESCGMHSERTGYCGNAALRLTRPPQSWCYVEEV